MIDRNVFIYWTGKDYPLIRIFRILMQKHQYSGKGYKLHYINDSNLSEYLNFIPENFDNLIPAHKADFIRIFVLNRFGGIWLDSDNLIMNNLDYYFEILEQYRGFFLKQKEISISFFGSVKDNPYLIEWITRSKKKIEIKDKLSWEEIGLDIVKSINKELPQLLTDIKILDAYKHAYPVEWYKCLEEFCLKPYNNYTNLITEERKDLVILVNSVYKHLESLSVQEIISSNMPLNYFINQSLINSDKNKWN